MIWAQKSKTKRLRLDKEISTKKGERKAFEKNWNNRIETSYIHWTRGEPENQIQLAFRNHWELFSEIMGNEVRGSRVLEVGCGRGSMSAYFADNGFDCTLLDSSESAIKAAKKVFKENGLKAKFDVGDAMRLPYDDGAFDIVFSIGLLEHFEDIEVPIVEQMRVLCKGGLFLGYVVPKYTDNVQKSYEWINDLLKESVDYDLRDAVSQKEDVYRSDADSARYLEVLKNESVRDINTSGVYPLPMISYSRDFPFTLLNPQSEKILVEHFLKTLDERRQINKRNPWLCDEGFGQAFLIWGYKK